MWIYLPKHTKICFKILSQKTHDGHLYACVCVENLFKSTVASSRNSSRKQKTGYCLASSLNRSSLILHLILWTQTQIHPISDALASNKRGHSAEKHRQRRERREGTHATEGKRPKCYCWRSEQLDCYDSILRWSKRGIFRDVAEAQSSWTLRSEYGIRGGSMRFAAAAELQVKTTHLCWKAQTVRRMAAMFCRLCPLREASVRLDTWCHLCAPAAWVAPIYQLKMYIFYEPNTMWSSFKATL